MNDTISAPGDPVPERLYNAKAVANFLGREDETGDWKPLHVDTVYRIPDRLLKRYRVGPRKGATRFKGSDILAYRERMSR